MRNPCPLFLAAAVYLAFWLCLLAFILFVGDFGPLRSVGRGDTPIHPLIAVLANLGPIAVFDFRSAASMRASGIPSTPAC